MKFGVLLRCQFLRDEDPVRCLEDAWRMTRQADALGFDSIAKGNHYGYSDLLDFNQMPVLARMAVEAPRARLLTGVVLLSLHKPLDIAEQLATLDVISNGRLIFGCALGYRQAEFDGFGTGQRDRVPRLEENLLVIKRLWTEARVHHDGTHFKLEGVTPGVLPVQRPHPPIWMGANADPAIRRAARLADCWYMPAHNKVQTLLRQLDVYRRELDHCGKPMPEELPMRREVFVAPTRREAIERSREALANKYRSYHRWGQDKPMPAGDNDLGQSVDALMADRFILGSPAEVTEQILAICRPTGVNHLVISTHNPGMDVQVAMDSMQLFAEEVMPAVRAGL
ncbi:MAG: LLM class flavin-dependent oxidoreductase [Gammaproteobacteria bacterium]|nr:LLM class flavin-dependent oxidoreductase [Gammaproteobacteria bacterium]